MEFIPKIVLTIYLEGRTLIRQSEPEIFHITKFIKGKKKVIKKKYYPKVTNLVSQKITIPLEAWIEFTTEDKCPHFVRSFEWRRMSKRKRAEAHFKQICDSLQGKYFTYEILED